MTEMTRQLRGVRWGAGPGWAYEDLAASTAAYPFSTPAAPSPPHEERSRPKTLPSLFDANHNYCSFNHLPSIQSYRCPFIPPEAMAFTLPSALPSPSRQACDHGHELFRLHRLADMRIKPG